jgi:hypothetical protein
MLIAAIILFIIAGFFGSFILFAILKNKPTPGPVVFVHGIVAVFALFALIAYAVGHMSVLLIVSIVLLATAALGGFTLLTIDMSKKPIPKLVAILHPFLAAIGFIVLLVYLYYQFAA